MFDPLMELPVTDRNRTKLIVQEFRHFQGCYPGALCDSYAASEHVRRFFPERPRQTGIRSWGRHFCLPGPGLIL